MATEKLEIQVSADVQKAVVSIERLQKGFQNFGGIAKNTASSLDNFNLFTGKTTPAALEKLKRAAGQSTQTLVNFGRVVQDAPFGIIGIANNIDPLVSSFTQLRASTGSAGAAFKALAGSLIGPAGIALAVSTVSSLLIAYTQNQQKAKRETKELKDETKSFADIQKDVSNSIAKEVTEVEKLVKILQAEDISRQNKVNALKQLKSISPEYFNGLKIEDGLVRNLSSAYAEYVKNIGLTIEAKTIEKQLEQINAKLLEGKTINQQQKVIGEALADVFRQNAKEGGNAALTQKLINQTLKSNVKLTGEDFSLNFQKNALFARLLEIYKLIRVEQKGGNDENKKGIEESEAALQGVLAGYLANSAALAEQVRQQQLLNDLQRKFNELRKSGGTPNGLTNPDDPSNRSKEPRTFTKEDLELLQGVETKIINIADTINNGINAGIDQFFNAIANNQDPFEALAQSAKRLVAELAAAVVKALILQAVSNALSGGAAGAGRAFASAGGGLFKGTIRGNELQLLTFLRGG